MYLGLLGCIIVFESVLGVGGSISRGYFVYEGVLLLGCITSSVY